MFADEDEPLPDFTIELAERLTGKTWEECRVVVLEDKLRYLERIKVERPAEWFQPPPHEPNRTREESEEILEGLISRLKEKASAPTRRVTRAMFGLLN